LAKDSETDVAIQALLTLAQFKPADLSDIVKATQAANKARGIKEIGDFLMRPAPAVAGSATMSPEELKSIEEGSAVYQSLCFSCHAADGRGTPVAGGAAGAMMAPPLAGSPRVNGHRDYIIKVLLKGLTGPLGEGSESSAAIMQPMGTNTDAWIANIASYVRSSFGNAGGIVTTADVARVRAATAGRKSPWTLRELEPTLPRRLESSTSWKLSASHNPDAAAAALTTRGWTSATPQAQGMWFVIELPQPAMLTEIRIRGPVPPAGAAAAPDAGVAAVRRRRPPQLPYPRGYRLELSMDGVKWGKPLSKVKAACARRSRLRRRAPGSRASRRSKPSRTRRTGPSAICTCTTQVRDGKRWLAPFSPRTAARGSKSAAIDAFRKRWLAPFRERCQPPFTDFVGRGGPPQAASPRSRRRRSSAARST
jgi:mono/diheme cytochrome c family protein